ncbi:AsmA-like C-terminal region-containing protein [Termitidicoccus mucosus]
MKKKPSRLLKILAALVILMALVVALAFLPWVQTMVARRVLAGLPDTSASVERVSIGLGHINVRGLTLKQPGVSVALPSAEIKMSLPGAIRERVRIESLVARGWTVELAANGGSPSAGTKAPPEASRPFEGIFQLLRFPVDLTVDRIDLAGEVVFPQAAGGGPGRAEVVIQGGQIGSGRDGRVTLSADARLPGADAPVSEVSIRSVIAVAMDSPRTIRSLAVSADAAATGRQFPNGARLSARASAAHEANGEDYALNISLPDANGGRQLVDFAAANIDGSADLTGRWTLDIRDTDVAPFTLGLALPAFSVGGEGTFSSDRAFSRTRAVGRLAVSLDKLAVLEPALAAVGALGLSADFDLSHRGDAVRVNRFAATLAGGAPVATVEALQVIELDHNTGALKVAEPSMGLARVVLQGLPLAWAQPFLGDMAVAGGPVRGEFVASAQNGCFVLRSTAPVELPRLSVARDGHELVRALDVSAMLTAGYSPAGWQAELSDIALTSEGATLATLSVKAAQPSGGTGLPVTAAGKLHANLPALLAQPAAAGLLTLSRGVADVDFTATAAGKSVKVDASYAFADLAAAGAQPLPGIAGNLRVDFADGGKIDAQLPLVIEHNSRKSDVELTASIQPDGARYAVNAQLVGNELYMEDVMLLAALAPSGQTPATTGGAAKPTVSGTAEPNAPGTATAPWDAVSGRLNLALKKVVYNADIEVRDLTGSVQITPALLSVETLRATLPDGCEAKVSGSLKYDAAAAKSYDTRADIEMSGFNPSSVLAPGEAGRKPVVEGKFDIKGTLSGKSATLGEIADTATADLQLTSRGGTFHGFNTTALTGYVGMAQKTVSTATKIINTLGSLTGLGKGNADLERARAIADTVGRLVEINFDQLNVNAAWRPGQDITVTDLSLISPDLRLTGAGSLGNAQGVRLARQMIDLNLNMAVRGDLAADLRVLNRLKNEADALGYTPLVEAFKVDGSLLQMGWASFTKLLGPKPE